MLRDIILTLTVLYCLRLTLRNPYAGVLAWTWFAIMQPHREAYGFFSSTLRLNLTIAVVTILGWFLSKERKLPQIDGTLVTLILFFAWITFNCIFAVDPRVSWSLWDETWRLLALGVMVGATANTRLRMHALTWVMMISLVYYGVKGGILSIMYAGGKHVTGPEGTIIGDNNQLALALLMILPLVNYLRLHSANRWVRLGLIVAGSLTFLSVISSYSRGAFLALGALSVLGWLRSRNKLLYPIFVAIIAWPVFKFMPPEFYDRMNTINAAGQDESFQGRVMAWKVAYYYARDHFPFGAGFMGPSEPQVWGHYFPGTISHVAHSIFFEVLGEQGFIGLALYLLIIFLSLINVQKIRMETKNQPDLAWARDLSTMIQLGLLVFCVGGAALSMAFYDVFIIWFLMLPALHTLVLQAKAGKSVAPSLGFQYYGPSRPATATAFHSSA